MQEAQTTKKKKKTTLKQKKVPFSKSDKFMLILKKITTFKTESNYSSHQHSTEDLKTLNKTE